jgi:hypothetical protein
MNERLRNKIVTELIWFTGLVLISALIEYLIIVLFDLHPILAVKIQGLIGLVIIAYGIRMVARMTDGFQESPGNE